MTAVKKMLIFCSIAVVSLFVLFVFRTVPSGNLWERYRIVYVDDASDEDFAADVLNRAGCENVISLSSQRLPLTLPMHSPEVSLALAFADADGYLAKRKAYFFDRGAQYRLYYIEERYAPLAEDAVREFRAAGIAAGIDTQGVYPFIVPLICTAFALLLCFLSFHRFLFFVAAVFPVFFAACVPLYSTAASACLFLYGLFIALRLWGRRGAFSVVKTNPAVIAFFASSLIASCASSFRSALLFMPLAAGTLSALAAFSTGERLYEARYRFTLIPIRPARAIPLFTKATFRGTAACVSSIAVFFAASLLSSFSIGFAASPFSHASALEFPSARAQSSAGNFPTLDEYVAWCWNTKTAPYRSVNAQSAHERHPKTGDTVVFPRYSDGEAGISETSVSMVFDKNFYDAALGDIDALPYPAVEKLIKAQGSRVHAGYAFSASGGGGLLHTLLVAFALCLPSILLVRSKMR
ncbi:hypothetical protein [Treponema sp. Marseille-Q4523]|uniref:hypothetical protein n=1 Tax=Treponema sp. Marseille-Q4523 TaxID=2810610 RepID=UPI00195FBE32|nr:hypothetical protein [Treponema sp. Marseille-Q4523]MBM7022723.1 hypothetical protein [Treponema sp. Marseille-Q4523]